MVLLLVLRVRLRMLDNMRLRVRVAAASASASASAAAATVGVEARDYSQRSCGSCSSSLGQQRRLSCRAQVSDRRTLCRWRCRCSS